MEAVLREKIEFALDTIRPYLEADGGNVRVVELTEDFVLKSGPTQDAYLKLAEEVARQIAIRNSSTEKTEVVEIKL